MPSTAPRYAFEVVEATRLDSLADALSEFSRQIGDARSPAYWRWCWGANPAGFGASVVAFRNDRLVGLLGNTYTRFGLAGRPATAGLIGHLAVLPSERSWHCYAGLVRHSLAKAVGDGVDLAHGFVVRSAAPMHSRLGATSLGRVPVVAGFLSVRRLLRGRGVPPPADWAGALAQPFLGLKGAPPEAWGIEVRPLVEPFGAEADDLWSSLGSRRPVSAVRDAAYLNWRYVQCPDLRYERLGAFRDGRLEGLAVYRSNPQRRAAYLVELLAREGDERVLAALLWAVLGRLAEAGAGLLTAAFPRGTAESSVLRAAGFRPVSWLWGVHHFVLPHEDGRADAALDPANWYVSLGDWLTH